MTDSMDEQTRALAYQTEKDSSSEWSDQTIGNKRRRRRLDAMISVRLSPTEVEQVRARAEREGLSVSAFLRRRALEPLAPTRPTVNGNRLPPSASLAWEPEHASIGVDWHRLGQGVGVNRTPA